MSGAKMPSSFDDNFDFYEENRWQKFARRFKEEPLIPFGCLLTCYALFRASRSIRAGDHHQTNRMFRARIYAQGFTLVCIVAGGRYYAEEREKRKVFENALSQKKAREKNEAWIRELEARDQEEREEKEARDRRRARAAAMAGQGAGGVVDGAAGSATAMTAGGLGVVGRAPTAGPVANAEPGSPASEVVRSVLEGEERRGRILEAVRALRWT